MMDFLAKGALCSQQEMGDHPQTFDKTLGKKHEDVTDVTSKYGLTMDVTLGVVNPTYNFI